MARCFFAACFFTSPCFMPGFFIFPAIGSSIFAGGFVSAPRAGMASKRVATISALRMGLAYSKQNKKGGLAAALFVCPAASLLHAHRDELRLIGAALVVEGHHHQAESRRLGQLGRVHVDSNARVTRAGRDAD